MAPHVAGEEQLPGHGGEGRRHPLAAHPPGRSQLLDQGGAVVTFLDVTEMRRLEQVRRDFVANASHELKTPLTTIRGFAETLRDGALEDKAHRLEFVEAIEKDAERLSALVEDLLDLEHLIAQGNARDVDHRARSIGRP